MAILRILDYPDPRLRTKTKPVTKIDDPDLQKIIDDMFETLYHTPNCAGLAATQLDIKIPPRVTVIDVSREKNQPLCLINAEIIATEEVITQGEACMSVYPDEIHGEITRAKNIRVRALDRHGKTIELEATDLLAKCIQHEIDHLNGMLYIDRLSTLKRQFVDKKVKKIMRWSRDDT